MRQRGKRGRGGHWGEGGMWKMSDGEEKSKQDEMRMKRKINACEEEKRERAKRRREEHWVGEMREKKE